MEKHFALIKNNLVEGVIVANESFLPIIKDKYDLILDVTDIQRPSTGDSYYPVTNTFISNDHEIVDIPADLKADHLQSGTEKGFKPFKISNYSVKYENGMIVIGCKKYSAPGFMDALHKILIEKQHTTSHFTTLEDGYAHGKFKITLEDAKKLYDALKKVKL